MGRTIFWIFNIAVATLVAAAFTVPVPTFGNDNFAPTGGIVATPAAWIDFCKRHPADCMPDTAPEKLAEGPLFWQTVMQVNVAVNTLVEYKTDIDNYGKSEYWTYPDNGYGDCEDIALLKRKILVQRGVARSRLLMTFAFDPLTKQGHALVILRTREGDMVLDDDNIVLWNLAPYHFYARQSIPDPNVWVSLAGSWQVSKAFKPRS
jgi:predicted transglutaminase-like cysteine proteinase